ncbi:MAG: aldo/keto reductase [Atopostipes suicloacalis]|nr:aldo/keto reductase [Atopostipes suicloacalis]MDN6731510.1 aldo/keto reductase [Atopostipes suicloacalis]
MNLESTYTLNDGVKIPVLGFGTYKMPNDEKTKEIVKYAIESGYRHIDTASLYKNEEVVGQAIREAIEEGIVSRDEIFVTTKLWNDDQGYESTKEALRNSLERLRLDYVDLYLIHWPNPQKYRDQWQEKNEESWRAMEEAQAEGKTRSIGVSNFMPRHLKPLLESAKVKPSVNQIMLNPSVQQKETVKKNKEEDILSVAYSPLARGQIFEIDELKEIAKKYNKTSAQIVLRWGLQHGFLPLPKTETMSLVKENADIFDFELSEKDMEKINSFKGRAGHMENPDQKAY